MTEKDYGELDDLFAKIRLRLALVRQSEPAAADELKQLLTQVEDWVESLVVDSLRLRSLKSGSRRQPKQRTDT